MTYTRIKICGITRPEEAATLAGLGIDAIGLVFYPRSPRAVSASQAQEIVAALPSFVQVVALFVDEPADVIERILAEVRIHTLQFHGSESAAFCEQFHRPYLKALRVREGMDLQLASAGYQSAEGLLLDSWQEGVPGGTGRVFDWQQARQEFPRPLVLAGGLTADNVGAGMSLLRPAAVDVSGGVEVAPGRKDPIAVTRFVAAVRETDKQLSGAEHDK